MLYGYLGIKSVPPAPVKCVPAADIPVVGASKRDVLIFLGPSGTLWASKSLVSCFLLTTGDGGY